MRQRQNKPASSCYDVALTQLGRRDFSSAELAQRLQDKGFSAEDIAPVMARLIEQKYVDDLRYARLIVRTRAQLSGWGVQRIRMDLYKRRLPEEVMQTVLADYEAQITEAEDGAQPWEEKATELLEKKYGRWQGSLDPKDYNKRMGFLVRRGFSLDQAKQALDGTKDPL